MKRLTAALLLMMWMASPVSAEVTPPADVSPKQLDISLTEFVQRYNGQEGVSTPIEAQQQEIDRPMHGIVYLSADEQVNVFVQLAYDQKDDQVLYAGCVMDKDKEPNFEGFLTVCDHVMGVVFPDLDPDARAALLMRVILEGDRQGAYAATSRNRSHTVTDGAHALKYVVDDENKRQLVAYVEE